MQKSKLIYHFRPRRVAETNLRFTLSFGLGGSAFVLILVQFISGFFLRFAYQPLPVSAYSSVVHLQNELFWGPLFRNLHHWSGHLLILLVFLHMMRILYQSAYFHERRWNWWIGIGLGILVCTANFTGYLLPWDQLSFWAVTIATATLEYLPMIGSTLLILSRGGAEVGADTLLLYYNLHTGVIPVLLMIGLSYHFWKIRKCGGLFPGRKEKVPGRKQEISGRKQEIPGSKQENEVRAKLDSAPHLFQRELAMTGLVLAFVFLLALFFDAPLQGMANPELTPETIRAPWYFIGLQEILLHVQPALAWFILCMAAVLFILLPLFSDRNRVAPLLCAMIVLAYILFTVTGLFFRGPAMQLTFPW